MDNWEGAFRAKSEHRRRRSQHNRLIKGGALLALISAMILLGLWAMDTLLDDVLGWL